MSSIATHKEFIQHCYAFRIHLQLIKNHSAEGDYRQAQVNAIVNFKKMMEIANREANGNGALWHDFESWLVWNYELNEEHSSLLMNEQTGLDPKCIDELMTFLRTRRETNKMDFMAALTEYEHAKGTLARRVVRKNQALYVASYFSSVLRKILAFDTIYMYENHRDRLEEELKYIVQRMQEFNFSQSATHLQSEWQTFEKSIQDINKSLAIQKEEINNAFELCILADKRTFLQQMAQKIGEIYESIRDQLRQIRNNAFALKQAFLNPIVSPIESAKNILHVICHPWQTAKVAWEWIRENPGKTAMLVIGTVGISLIIGAVVGVVGTALYTGTSILSVTAADFIVGGVVGGTVLTTTTFTAIGGKAARESAITASNAIDSQIMLRKHSLKQLDREEEEYRKHARQAMRNQRKKDEIGSRPTSYELLNNDTANVDSQHVASTLENDCDRLNAAAQEMQFAKEDISRELVATYQEERAIDLCLGSIIRQSQQVKEAIRQNQNNRIKSDAKQLVSILNEQDRFDDAARTLNALKNQDYDELENLVNEFSLQNNSTEVELNESSENDHADNIE